MKISFKMAWLIIALLIVCLGAGLWIVPDVDLVVFSYNRPIQLYALLESIEKYVTGDFKIKVVYRSDPKYQAGYNMVQKAFQHAKFVRQQLPPCDFRSIVERVVFKNGRGRYVIFAVDDLCLTGPVNLQYCIDLLEQSRAYSFVFRLGKNIDYSYMTDQLTPPPPLDQVAPEVYKFRFSDGKGDWAYPNSLDLALYRKAEIYRPLMAVPWRTPNQLESHWAAKVDLNKTGLCFEQSRMVNLPLNKVNPSTNRSTDSYTAQELLEHFLSGQKIDIDQIAGIKNRSPHIDHEIEFILR